jgi:Transposase DDE domain
MGSQAGHDPSGDDCDLRDAVLSVDHGSDLHRQCVYRARHRIHLSSGPIWGGKRHALVDTDGRGLVLEPHSASIQDRDGGGPLLQASRRIFPFIQRVFADSGYAGEKVAKATLIAVEIVRKSG